jgi:hypothetical protein
MRKKEEEDDAAVREKLEALGRQTLAQISVMRKKADRDETGRRIELGEVAYEAYRSRLALHQPEKCLEWHRFPPYMRDVWAYVGEAVIGYEKASSQISGGVDRVGRIGVKRARKGYRRGTGEGRVNG